MELNDLSVIAEDDEPLERGRLSTSTPGRLEHEFMANRMHHTSPEATLNNTDHVINMSSTASRGTFHSIPLDSLVLSSVAKIQTEVSPVFADTPQLPVTREEVSVHPDVQPSSKDGEDFAMADVQEELAPLDQKSLEKPSVMSFPTLPEPMPLRKSIRHPRDASTNTTMLGVATPGAPIGGKRTSWLMKAREVKALEVTTKKTPIQPMIVPAAGSSASHSMKRKSEDFLATPDAERDDGERQPKVPKITEGETAPRKLKDIPHKTTQEESIATKDLQIQHISGMQGSGQEGVLDRLKKTVEGLGARVSKTMGKSLGGGAATALAEARAAAEAKVAERDRKEEEMTMAFASPYGQDTRTTTSQDTDTAMSSTRQNEGRLSISDLFPMEGRVKEKHKVPEKTSQYTPKDPPQSRAPLAHDSTTTTPPTSPSPPANLVSLASAPGFNKPHPVFIPPQPSAGKSMTPLLAQFSAFKTPSEPKYNPPASIALGFSPPLSSKSSLKGKAAILTAQSTLESVQSDQLFERDDAAWIHGTQDTEYSTEYETQSQPQNPQICDEDDSWPVDEKLAAGVQWTFGGSKDDSMTWSTLPSQSQRDTGPVTKTSPIREERDERDPRSTSHQIPGAFDMVMFEETDDEAALPHDAELEQIILASPRGNTEVS